MRDVDGNEIRVGSLVEHIDPEGFHMMRGSNLVAVPSRVIALHGHTVEVNPCCSAHIPVHLPCFLRVVKE